MNTSVWHEASRMEVIGGIEAIGLMRSGSVCDEFPFLSASKQFSENG